MPKSTKKYTYSLGRRKSSIASLKLFKGKGDILVNGLPINNYFGNSKYIQIIQTPFVVTQNLDNFYFESKVTGGGKVSQSEAVRLALARAIDKFNSDYHTDLKKAGLLTVDSRIRQRRQVGTGGKARRQKQSPKR